MTAFNLIGHHQATAAKLRQRMADAKAHKAAEAAFYRRRRMKQLALDYVFAKLAGCRDPWGDPDHVDLWQHLESYYREFQQGEK